MSGSINCEGCEAPVPREEFERSLKVCTACGHHHRLTCRERLAQFVDEDSFEEHDAGLRSVDFMEFPRYSERLERYRESTGLLADMLSGRARVGGHEVILCITDMAFIGGSMGSVVGEKITRACERGVDRELPLVIISASGGGARMDEGTVALMQMAKTSAAVMRHRTSGLFYLSIATDPTMGGTAASFVSLGTVNVAEPGAMIGFAGPRARAAIGENMPDELQRSESLLRNGMLDMVVPRQRLRGVAIELLDFVNNHRPAH